MGFFKNRKAKKLAEQQAKEALEQRIAEDLRAKLKAEEIKEAPSKIEPVVEEEKKASIKTTPSTVKTSKVEKPTKKIVDVNQKIEKPVPESGKQEAKPSKYHVSQNKDPKSDNHRKWRVRKEGSDKTIKFFETQKEAIEYADGLALAAGSSVVIHKLDGSIRKQVYKK